jgi:membrane protein YqaA with SNARE-associated domain
VSAVLSNLFGFFFLPFGNDAAIVYLVARDPNRVWLLPLMATAGSVTGGALTYWIGARAGEAGLPRLASTLWRRARHPGRSLARRSA